jgi:serine protease
MADLDAVLEAVRPAVAPGAEDEMRFALVVTDRADAEATAAALESDLSALGATVARRSPDELMLVLKGHRLADETAAFRAADALVAAYPLDAAEPEIFFTAMPIDLPSDEPDLESIGDVLGCWAEEEDALRQRKRWALEALRVTRAWAFAEAQGRPSRGEGVLIAQPDTGITRHPEIEGVPIVAQRNLIGARREDATDPLTRGGNPGHGTATSSVAVSPETLDIAGSAPRASLMPIRAIENVARLSQLKVAEAIDYAVDNGAHVISMSLGGVASIALWRALSRAVDAGVVVVAAAGNCVRLVVWPARYEKCIAVAGVGADDRMWQGSSRGSAVDVAAPAQNVYRATAADRGVGQGQGTSYATALVAGVAACWVAHHGRANAIAEARRRGETLQDMFRRLLKATARQPAGVGWNGFDLGAGIVDAEALLKADFDLGLGTEGPTPPAVAETPGWSVRSLAYETAGPAFLESTELDWDRHGTEISLALLRGRLTPLQVTPDEAAALLESLAPPPDGAPAAPAPARRWPASDAPVRERLRRQQRIIAARAAMEEGVFLESAADQPLTRQRADATLDRVVSLAERMPAREVRDRQAFAGALKLLVEHGGGALRKLVEGDLTAEAGFTGTDSGALEAIIIADGSRPSFLVEDGLPPANHPFMGAWHTEVTTARPKLKPICDAIGRIQPRFGHAGNFMGTGCLVDAAKGIVLTNYHVLDDARTRFGVLMSEAGDHIRIDGWLEIDFLGEAAVDAERRFRVVEARLPRGYGRGMGRLDAATLRIEPLDGAEMPEAIRFDGTRHAFNQATGTSFCTVGFPGPPRRDQGPRGEVDWNFVVRILFGDMFGVKRLAPGRVRQASGVAGDPLGIVFSHEATTFGGASGSALIGWQVEAKPGFGLHFSGATEVANYAIGVGRAATNLQEIGVPL